MPIKYQLQNFAKAISTYQIKRVLESVRQQPVETLPRWRLSSLRHCRLFCGTPILIFRNPIPTPAGRSLNDSIIIRVRVGSSFYADDSIATELPKEGKVITPAWLSCSRR